MKWKENIPSGQRRPRGLVKGGKGGLPTSAGSPAQFPEITKNSFFQSRLDELRPLIKLTRIGKNQQISLSPKAYNSKGTRPP